MDKKRRKKAKKDKGTVLNFWSNDGACQEEALWMGIS
jgi:hypothetical protein